MDNKLHGAKISTRRLLSTTVFLVLLILTGCIEPYNPPAITETIDILVVDGFLNGTDSSATVQLSKATPLASGEGRVPELNASVRVEDETGNHFPLTEIGDGNYIGTKLPVNSSLKYRLFVSTNNRKEYVSDYVELRGTPPIDSITYGKSPQSDGLTIYMHTHDPANNTRYYQWTYLETWEYTAGYFSSLEIKGGVVVVQDENIYQCWNSRPSTEINISSTTQLTNDAIRNFELQFIPKGSQKISRRYCLDVQQRALTKEAYDFWLQLKKTTESLGSLFDPLPSQVIGNLRSTTETAQPVLGYFSGGTVSKKRIFIGLSDLPSELLNTIPKFCPTDTIRLIDVATRPNMNLISSFGTPFVQGYTTSFSSNCLDCRDGGGKNVRPDFW